MKFSKLQGAGNDFILLEAGNLSKDWSQLAIKMCDRHIGIGSDGLLLLVPSKAADFGMRMFNPDGSEAEACGNGLRCLAKHILETRLDKSKARGLVIETLAGNRKVKYTKEDNETGIQVSMGKPKFEAADIPVTIEGKNPVDITPILGYPLTVNGQQLKLDFVSMGNPHAILFTKQPLTDFPLSELGPKIERHSIFPKRINFEVAHPVNKRLIEVRVWERGAGETLACGTGACAVAVAAQLHGYCGNKVDIKVPGGTLNVAWDRVGEVFLGGPARIVFTGDWIEEQ